METGTMERSDLSGMATTPPAQGHEVEHWLGAAPVGVQHLDRDGRVVWANAAQLEMLGYAWDQYVGRSVVDFHADDAAGREVLAALRRGEPLRGRAEAMRHRDGSVRHVLISSVCRGDDEGGGGGVANAC